MRNDMEDNFLYTFQCWLNKREYPDAKLPVKKYSTDAGFDISSAESCQINPGETRVVHTGVHFNIVPGWEIQIRSRSGLAAKNNIFVLNSPATIDAGYTGEIMVILHNASEKKSLEIKSGDRIAQLVFQRVPEIQLVEIEQPTISKLVEDKIRGTNGFGSSGV
jgi:dUTP pyrophosphatase